MNTSVQVTAQDVNKLRQITGAGFMDCKHALVEAQGNLEEAINILRKKGQKVADKRADRDAREGYVITLTNSEHTKGILMVLNCETDFVAKNSEFTSQAQRFAAEALAHMPASLQDFKNLLLEGRPISEHITDLVGKIGEKIEIGFYCALEGNYVYGYNHPGNRVASLVALNKRDVPGIEQLAKDVAMQVAAMAPVAVDKSDVPETMVQNELEIARELLRKEGKPEDKIEMIARGKLEKFYKENTLLNQDFIKDSKITVRQYLQSADKELTVEKFFRYALG
ncbi:MAG: translation elongation factor Ts [Flavobacteriales bacterium]|nr:translation elongation factor Ts [Flavobacteriales bacterium]MCX7768625.1 translation elongation factor Ts [Flavobacteriales bacterium]MDW8409722.1 translation elongation factor Ts [Flavobacteriales bacterium]